MEKTLISVIIPVYNSAEFLSRCLKSLQNQTYKNWEAICIDDGSIDDSGRILDEFSFRDERFRVVHKENEGVSAARNEGIKYAQGEFVTFLDSDDFLHPQALELTGKIMAENNVDFVAYTYDRSYRIATIVRHLLHIPESKSIKFKNYSFPEIKYKITADIYHYATEYSHPAFPKSEMNWAVKHCQPWRALYKRDLIKDLKFPEGIIYEDFPWWGEVLLGVKKAAILNLPLYFYYPNRKSFIFSSNESFKISSLQKAISLSEDIYSDRGSDYQKEMWNKNFLEPFKAKLRKKAGKG